MPWKMPRKAGTRHLSALLQGTTGEEHELPPYTATFVLSLAKVQQMAQEAAVSPDSPGPQLAAS